MELKAGIYIKSTAALKDTFFADSTIFISSYNKEGAIGFIINRPFNRSLNQLEEFKHSPHFPLFDGGPVNQEHLYFLHQLPELIQEGNAVGDGVYLGGNFKQAITGINNKSITTKDIKIFVGYCGWDRDELEGEIEEGSWLITSGLNENVFC